MGDHVEFTLRGDGLPEDVKATNFTCHEALSTLYEVEVEFKTSDASFVVDTLLRKSATLVIEDNASSLVPGVPLAVRTVSGICDRAEFLLYDQRDFHFRLRLRPPISALGHREDCRIYQDKSVVDVVNAVLDAAGITKREWLLTNQPPPREFIVQYRETELNFVSRLLEDIGIFYWFTHDEGETTIHFGDDLPSVQREPTTPVYLAQESGPSSTDVLHDCTRTYTLGTSDVRLRDYDFEKPEMKPDAQQAAGAPYPMSYYEYPGGFTEGPVGAARANARIRELRRNPDVLRAATRFTSLEVGTLVTTDGVRQDDLNGRFVVTELTIRGTHTHNGKSDIDTHFAAIPMDQVFAPPRTAKKPRIGGLQTATVMGPTNEEQAIYVDKYGRIKVRFHWDRVGQRDDKASCWLRVMQVPLGGSIIHPRVSWEVSVAFFEGDPDRPFVLGRLYNAEKTPPYALPATKTSGALKSMSTPGAAGHNEINLGDSGGSQGFSTHAQKDMNSTIGNDKTEKVGVDETQNVKVNRSTSVGADQKTTVGGNQSVTVGAVAELKITGDQSVSVSGNSKDDATANYVEKVGSDRSYDVGGHMTVICNTTLATIAGNLNRDVGTAMVAMSIASISDTVGGDYKETISAVRLDLCKGNFNETVSGSKKVMTAAADVHLVKGNWSQTCDGSVLNLVGGLHYHKVAGDFSIKAPNITLVGAVGEHEGGGSNLKLGGGPVVMAGSKISVEAGLLVRLGGGLKLA